MRVLSSMQKFVPLFFCLAVWGCKPAPKIVSYEVNSEATSRAQPPLPTKENAKMQANAAMEAEAASFGQPKWPETPAGWVVGAPNAMRKGSWIIHGEGEAKAEMAVTVFPGDVGGIAANVNRWRGQLGLPPADEASILASAQSVQVGTVQAKSFRLESADGKRYTVAVIASSTSASWFFKLSGDSQVVKAQTDTFLKFLTHSQLP